MGGNPKTSSLANPGNVIYSTAGTFSASLTVTDNGGLTDPHPPSRTVTIPDFSVAMSPGSRSTTPGNGAAYTVNVIAGASFTANVSFNVAGLPTGASASFSPSTVTASGSSIMTVTTNALTPPGNYSLSLVATSGTLAHTTVASLIVLQSTGTTLIDFGSGFTGTGMQFNGHTKLNGTRLQLTDKTAGNEVASAFWNTPVNVQGFNSDFTFQVTNPVGDGFTFCIQGVGPTAIGQSAGNLGYGGISKSMAVKFDLHSSSGDDGQNATGLYINGTPPTTPSNPLTGGVNLLSGDVFQVQMTYDGTTLAMTVTDVTNPANTSSISWPIDIPTTIGSSTAYAGFTAATGGTTAIQEILGWSYASSTNAVSQPNFSVAISPSSQSITQGGSTTFTATITPTSGVPGDISLSVNGLPTGATSSFAPASLPGAGSSTLTVSTSSTVVTGTYPLTVTASSGSLSHTVTTLLLITQNGVTPTINFGTGFAGGGMQFNGHTKLNGTRLQLTDTTAGSEVASAFWNSPVNVGNFTSDFTFQLTNPNSDGFTFAIQNIGPTAIGPSGSGLGYASILSSVAVKFDLHSNAGEGANSTGLYVNGAVPTLPSTSITGGLNLHSGHILQAHLTYDGATLMLTLTDLTTVPALTFSTSWPINITSTIGSNTAYFGFTAATGGTTATQEVVGWTYSTSLVSQSAATPTVSPPGGKLFERTSGFAGGYYLWRFHFLYSRRIPAEHWRRRVHAVILHTDLCSFV